MSKGLESRGESITSCMSEVLQEISLGRQGVNMAESENQEEENVRDFIPYPKLMVSQVRSFISTCPACAYKWKKLTEVWGAANYGFNVYKHGAFCNNCCI